jgi:vanillate O-demethylase monooxygenase subunit
VWQSVKDPGKTSHSFGEANMMERAVGDRASRFLRNAWYMAGWSGELPQGRPLERAIAGISLVLWRDQDGEPCVLRNRCPHRFAPLHMGKCLPAGVIQCAYHGLQFDGRGNCVLNPHGDGRIPAGAVVRYFRAVERHGMIWVWMGDPECADLSLLPDFSAIDEARCSRSGRYMRVNAGYTLETDNILDLSHIEFLHPGTLGSDKVKHAEVDLVQEGNTVHSRRFIREERLSPFLENTFQIPPGQLADRWLDVRWDPPASMLLSVTIAPSGQAREAGNTILIPHVFTPATAIDTHYWFASCFDRARYDDAERRAVAHVEGLSRPFSEEDLPMLQAQQAAIGDAEFWSLKPALLPGDKAAIRARRLLDAMLQREWEHDQEQKADFGEGRA